MYRHRIIEEHWGDVKAAILSLYTPAGTPVKQRPAHEPKGDFSTAFRSGSARVSYAWQEKGGNCQLHCKIKSTTP